MNYPVLLIQTEEGVSVSCPALPGCHSQGETVAEALENIRDAIALWLEVASEEESKKRLAQALEDGEEVTQALVAV